MPNPLILSRYKGRHEFGPNAKPVLIKGFGWRRHLPACALPRPFEDVEVALSLRNLRPQRAEPECSRASAKTPRGRARQSSARAQKTSAIFPYSRNGDPFPRCSSETSAVFVTSRARSERGDKAGRHSNDGQEKRLRKPAAEDDAKLVPDVAAVH